MFWSPAVATFSTCCCAAAGKVMAPAARTAARIVLRMESSLVLGAWEQVQRPERQAQADGGVEIEVALVRDREVTLANRHRIAVVAARIGALRDAAGQHDGAVNAGARLVELGDIVAKIGPHRTRWGNAVPRNWRLVPRRPDLDTRGARSDGEVDGVVGAHEARDEWRDRLIVDLFRRADLGDAASLHDDDAIGHGHGLLAVVRDVNGREAEPAL